MMMIVGKRNLSKQLNFLLPLDLPHIYIKLLDVHVTATLLQRCVGSLKSETDTKTEIFDSETEAFANLSETRPRP